MSVIRLSSRLNRWLEQSVLTTDTSRALRSSLAFLLAWVGCLWAGQPAAAVFIATAAQNVALVDVRGDYRARLAILLTLTLVMTVATLAGVLTGDHVVSATLMMGALALLGGVWRHVSGDYGPNLAVVSGLLFLLALAQPGGWQVAGHLAGLVALGGVGAIFVQMAGWFFRPQHPLRHAVAESWVATSDLFTAMRTETNEGDPAAGDFTGKEQELRATLDRTLAALQAVQTERPSALVTHLDAAHYLAARLAMRGVALHTAMETLKARPDFVRVSPTFDSVLRAMANAARSAALTLITHRAEQFVALEVRLRRCAHLLRILDARLAAMSPSGEEVAQVRQMLDMIGELLPVMRSALNETVDHGSVSTGFSLRLPELGGLSLRSLGSWLNPASQLDPILVRYSARVAVITMLSVAIYKWFAVPRGYWIAFAAIVVLQPDYGSTRQKAAQRIVGTVAGSVLGSLLLWVKMPLVLLLGLAAVTAFWFAYYLKKQYGLAIFYVTLMLVLITDAVAPLHLDFTVGRVLSNVAGGVLALIAALLFWPSWEQGQFPKIISAAVRANRKYLDAVAARLTTGEPFAGDVVQAKREAERANALASASVQRFLSEPSIQQSVVERAAALATYNQRVTRLLTVLGLCLNKRQRLDQPQWAAMTRTMSGSLDELAEALEAGRTISVADIFPGEPPAGAVASGAELVYNQLTKIVTEIEAMTLVVNTPVPTATT